MVLAGAETNCERRVGHAGRGKEIPRIFAAFAPLMESVCSSQFVQCC